ncbi:kinase-like domain-containing protein [Xylaria arbuscula]|nr:kinase-like domain-containing protein [Xylaria arbuscula]
MSDTDLIARVFPLPGTYFDEIQRMIQRNPLCKAPKTPNAHTSQQIPLGFNSDLFHSLEIRFSHVPKTHVGLVFGTSEDCDVVLPPATGISRRHFTLTYKNTFSDNHHRLILRDLDSRGGTAVSYDGQGRDDKRSRFDWILDGFLHPRAVQKLTVELVRGYGFQIEVNQHHDLDSSVYGAHVKQFLHGRVSAMDLLGNVALSIIGNETQAQTPGQGEIILTGDVIGKGSFGIVTRNWNVSTGVEYACKQPRSERDFHVLDWQHEIEVMNELRHENIVKFYFGVTHPSPKIFLEYIPFGNLKDAHKANKFTRRECLKVLMQCSSALIYLHEEKLAAHRDIKPGNILVKNRDMRDSGKRNPGVLHVQLADFGLSKHQFLFHTPCGTPAYKAPEVDPQGLQFYTTAVDIWSLGVVILKLVEGIPREGVAREPLWHQKIVSIVQAKKPFFREDPDVTNLLNNMLNIDPLRRPSARLCYDIARRSDIQLTARVEGVRPSATAFAPAPRQQLQHGGISAHYKTLDYGQIRIGYREAHRVGNRVVEDGVNILHLSRIKLPEGVPPSTMRQYVNQHIPVSDRDQCKSGALTRGTYLKFSDALMVCRNFKNKEGEEAILQLRQMLAAMRRNAEPAPVRRAENIPNPLAARPRSPASGVGQEGQAESRVSYYRERSYADGSYLCPQNESYKQLRE